MQITAKAPKVNKEMTVEYDLGKDCDDACAKYGKDVVHSKFVDAEVVTIQGIIRNGLEKNVSEDVIRQRVAQHKPGVKGRGVVDYEEAFLQDFAKLSPQEQQKKIKEMQEKSKEIAAQQAATTQ